MIVCVEQIFFEPGKVAQRGWRTALAISASHCRRVKIVEIDYFLIHGFSS
jgi:hypothetical protein